MLPFVRMLEYGNIRPAAPTIVDVRHSMSTTVTTYILRSNGELWGGGDNSSGQLAQGNISNTYKNTCIKLRSDVKMFAHYSECTLVYTTDNKLLFCGFDYRISSPSSEFNRTNWFDISSRFGGLDLTKIKQIGCTRMNIYIITESGEMYSTGFFRALGAGMTSGGNYTNTPSLLATDVDYMNIGGEEVITFRKNNGTIWGFGNNGYARVYALDVSSPSSTQSAAYVPSPVQMFIAQDVANIMGVYGGPNNTLVFRNNGTTVGCGSQYYGTLGAGMNTDSTIGYLSTAPLMTQTLPIPCASMIKDNANSMQRAYLGTDGYYYMIGYNAFGELGIGVTKGTGNDYAITVWTKNETLPVQNSEVKGFSFGYFTSYMYTNNSLYVAGNGSNSVSNEHMSGSNPIFLKVTLPF